MREMVVWISMWGPRGGRHPRMTCQPWARAVGRIAASLVAKRLQVDFLGRALLSYH